MVCTLQVKARENGMLGNFADHVIYIFVGLDMHQVV